MELSLRILVGALSAVAIAIAARRAGSLSSSGTVAAVLTGTAAAAAGWNWAALLIAYFVSSSLLSRLGRARKREHTAGMIEKAGARDAMQVASNGLPFAILAVTWTARPDSPAAVMVGAAASLAASASDTWATEIGTWVGQTPRSILTFRKLPIGQSGGITAAGIAASIAGAAFVAAVAGLAGWERRLLPGILIGGIFGALADSIAGALLQQRRWCDACSSTTEMRIHDCGAATRSIGGLRLVDNDAVNLIATTAGALLGMLMTPGMVI
jgi:uncharacterized protein (TIGR00297 family)